MTDFFDLPDDSFSSKNGSSERKVDENIYNPDPNAHNGKYQSVFRFIPYIHDKALSKFTKYSAKFWNPLTKDALYIDCPSNAGNPSILWDLETVIKGLKDEEPELHKKLSDSFSRWHSNWSPVYIKKDPQRQELEGTIKLFKYAHQINMMIEEQIKPEETDLIEAESCNPFHLLEGKDFYCHVGKKTKIFRDWTKCKFMDEVTPFVFKIKDTSVIVENNEKSIKLVQEFMKKNTPKLDEYFHKEWTDEQFEKVAQAMVTLIQPRAVLDRVLDRTKDERMKALILSKLDGTAAPAATPSAPAEDIEFKSEEPQVESTPDAPLEPVSEEAAAPATESETAGEGSKDEYDKLFDDL